jgi:hypothetical protein
MGGQATHGTAPLHDDSQRRNQPFADRARGGNLGVGNLGTVGKAIVPEPIDRVGRLFLLPWQRR